MSEVTHGSRLAWAASEPSRDVMSPLILVTKTHDSPRELKPEQWNRLETPVSVMKYKYCERNIYFSPSHTTIDGRRGSKYWSLFPCNSLVIYPDPSSLSDHNHLDDKCDYLYSGWRRSFHKSSPGFKERQVLGSYYPLTRQLLQYDWLCTWHGAQRGLASPEET